MTFEGNIKDSLIDNNSNLSVAYTTSSHNIEYGGCSGNIAYSLKLLGDNPIILAIAGNDFDQYKKWLIKNNIETKNIFINKEKNTACAHILTDSHQNQFTMFSPGAMESDSFIKLDNNDYELAILSPEIPSRMLLLAKYFIEKQIPYIFDPGQMVTVFNKMEDIEFLIKNSIGIILNEYEEEIIIKKFGNILKSGFIIKTLGDKGAEINGQEIIPSETVEDIVDSTGCGDAFRAGFIHGYINNNSLEESCAIGAKIAAECIKLIGTQNHILAI